ncbi:MAG: M20/M25/M40 family metallo-hydrolase [Kiritimatiellia bacterium]
MKWFEANREKWYEFLRFPSVGTDPKHLPDCKGCAEWLREELVALGFTVELLGDSEVPPIVHATWKSPNPAAKTVLFYGHYDVQPADPIELWETGPWEPTLRGDRVYARGAQDNKGQIWWTLQGIRAALESGEPLPNLLIVLEGQEESGSSFLLEVVAAEPARFKADVLMVADTGMASDGRPAITGGLRGVSSISFRLHGPRRDLHSGGHGGLALNPVTELASIVASLHHEDGSIAVEGFTDGMREPTAEEIALVMEDPIDVVAYQRETGVPPVGGPQGVAPEIRGRLLPTIEVNGFHGGYAGEGGKTIIPAWAEVKLSMRTVPGQTPASCVAALRRHFEARVKPGLRLELVFLEPGTEALRVSLDSPAIALARQLLGEIDPRGAIVRYGGASIHVIGALAAAAGADPLLVGFGLEQDRIHAPNESFSLSQAEACYTYAVAFLKAMGDAAK